MSLVINVTFYYGMNKRFLTSIDWLRDFLKITDLHNDIRVSIDLKCTRAKMAHELQCYESQFVLFGQFMDLVARLFSH